ncbi:hypothetical protein VCHA53O466_50393 [Vibrio chagasii]|nr:hypothetical protein VCHA53O466_50393 [Vibrio chagasii]
MIPTIKVNPKVVEVAVERFIFSHANSEHGISHWLRVMGNGFAIAQKNDQVDPAVIFWFALFHDSCRENEYTDPEHGLRASQLLREHRSEIALSDEQFEKLCVACETHSLPIIQEDPTVAACHDADRLDLGRVSKTTRAEYLGLEESKDPDFLSACISNGYDWTINEPLFEWLGLTYLLEID